MLRSLLARLRGDPAKAESPDDEQNAQADEAEDSDTDGDDEDSNSVWDLIPNWQYDGRHVESGGMTQDEQERAIRDVQRQAAEIERSDTEDGTPEQ